MRKSFDIIDEKWLPVIMTDGTEAVVSTREAFEKAAEIKRLNVKSDLWMDEYCAYCFLYVLTVRAFGLSSGRKISKLHQEGKFSVEQFDEYISECREVCTFDILDKNHPFMQKMPPKGEKAKWEIGKLMPPTYPSGNNAIMFRKRTDAIYNRKLTPEDFFIALLRIHRISSIDGAGYSASPFLASGSPLVAIPQGHNLFETLLMGIPAKTENIEEEKPFWEQGKYESAKYGFGGEWVSNCFVPVRYVHYGDVDEDGYIKSVYYSSIPYVGKKGMYKSRFIPKKNGEGINEIKWAKDMMIMHAHNEPHIVYKGITEEGTVEMRSYSGEEISYLTLITSVASAESEDFKCALRENPVIQTSAKASPAIEYDIYGISYHQAKAEKQMKIHVAIPSKLINSEVPEKQDANVRSINGLLKAVTQINAKLRGAICYSYGETSVPADKRSQPMKECQKRVVKELGDYVNCSYEDILNTLVKTDSDTDREAWLKLWYGRLFGKALDIYKKTPVHRGDVYAHKHAVSQYFNVSLDRQKGEYWDSTKEKIRAIYDAVRDLPKDYQYRLRAENKMDIEKASALAKAIYYSSIPEDSQKLKGAFRYTVLFANSILSEGSNGNIKFQTYLKEISKESATSQRDVLRLLDADDILDDFSWEQAHRLIKRASVGSMRRHLDLIELFTDMELWKSSHTVDRWIAAIAPKTKTAKADKEDK